MPNKAILDTIASSKIVTIEKMGGMTMFVIDPPGAPATEGGADAPAGGLIGGEEGEMAADAKKGYITVALPDEMVGDADYAEGQTFGGGDMGGAEPGEADDLAMLTELGNPSA